MVAVGAHRQNTTARPDATGTEVARAESKYDGRPSPSQCARLTSPTAKISI